MISLALAFDLHPCYWSATYALSISALTVLFPCRSAAYLRSLLLGGLLIWEIHCV